MSNTTEAVRKFLRDQNRPYSANDVLQNVGKEHGKGAVQKSLDDLARKGEVLEKTYGKQKVYCISQEDVADPNEMAADLRQMDQRILDLTESLKTVEEQLQSNVTELKGFQGQMSMKEAQTKRDELEAETAQMAATLDELKNNSKPVSDGEKTKIKAEHEKYLKEYRKRKRTCMDIINSILEGYSKTKKHLFEDIGIETDEDVGFKLEGQA